MDPVPKYVVGGTLATVVLAPLFTILLATGNAPYVFDIGGAIESVSPYTYAVLGLGACMGFSALGAAW